jgi:hypothetical protein
VGNAHPTADDWQYTTQKNPRIIDAGILYVLQRV